MPRVLVAEDEPAIADAVAYALRTEGFEVETVGDGESALDRARNGEFDVLILDLLLPRLGGTEVCRRLRVDSDLPIIMLTARSAEADRVLGLEIGADDYVTKPFSMRELIGRVRAILRRRDLDRARGGARRIGGLELDPSRYRVSVDGEPQTLTPSEFRLLELLASEPDHVFSRRAIMQHLWESSHIGDERACDVHVANLRRKIERDSSRPERLLTVRGIGYKLVPV